MEPSNEQPIEPVQSSKNVWTIVISVVITAIIVGGGIYLWRQLSLEAMEQKLQQQITVLQNQINGLKNENSKLKTTKQAISTRPSATSTDIDFPVVVYERAGLLIF